MASSLFKKVKELEESLEGETHENLFLMANYLYLLADKCAERVTLGLSEPIHPIKETKPTPAMDYTCAGCYWVDKKEDNEEGKKKRGRPSKINLICSNKHTKQYKGPPHPKTGERLYICQTCYKKIKKIV